MGPSPGRCDGGAVMAALRRCRRGDEKTKRWGCAAMKSFPRLQLKNWRG